MRMLIYPQIQQFRAESLQLCAICDFGHMKLEVDHIEPFSSLLSEFESLTDVDRYVGRMSDYEEEWIGFHGDFCTLQLLCEACHKVKTHCK
jgi:hypothetical protein